jgi:hypothetical protein
MIDKRMGSYTSECLETFARLALRCCADETDARPSIAEVVHELEKIFQLMPTEEDHDTPFMQNLMDPMDMQKKQSNIFSENPFVSADISGSDLLSGNIPGIAPR